MAWYALYNWFIQFRKKPYTNWISFYKQYLYDKWFWSLSKEDQEAEIERKFVEEKRNKEKAMETLAKMNMMLDIMDRISDYPAYILKDF